MEEYDIRSRVRVIAIAPADLISPDLCRSVLHVMTKKWYRDAVPRFSFLINPLNFIKCFDTIRFVESHPSAKMHDHDFKSPTTEI